MEEVSDKCIHLLPSVIYNSTAQLENHVFRACKIMLIFWSLTCGFIYWKNE